VVAGAANTSAVVECASCQKKNAATGPSLSGESVEADKQALLGLLAGDASAHAWTKAVGRLGQHSSESLSATDVARELDSQRTGIAGAPSSSTRDVLIEPHRKQQWEALEPWEKDLWNEFLGAHRDAVDITQSPDELHADAGVRFTMALLISYRYMPEGVREGAKELFTDSTFLTTTMVAITAYLALWLAPEPIFSKASAIISTVGLVAVAGFAAGEIIHLARAIRRLSRDTEKARTMRDIERAAERFGKSFGAASLRVLLALALVHGSKHMPQPPPAPSSGSLALAGAHGGTIATAIPRSATQIKMLADGTVHIIQGGMTSAAMSSASSGGGTTNVGRPEPGEWQPVSETMSPRAKAYQEQVTGRKAGESYVVHGVRFDGYKNGKLIEAKGQGYEDFMSVEGGFLQWFKRGEVALMKQAGRQFLAAEATGVPVEWHVAEERFAELLIERFKKRGWNSLLQVIHTPKSP
jgi:hypothetical protein